MSRRPAILTQADIARAIRAARQEGAAEVEVLPSGSICIKLVPSSPQITVQPLEQKRVIVL